MFHQNACAEEMIRQLGVDNATEVLRLAHLHWCPELKLAAMQFIAANYSAMVESETWHEFATLYPSLVQEIVLLCYERVMSSTSSADTGTK